MSVKVHVSQLPSLKTYSATSVTASNVFGTKTINRKPSTSRFLALLLSVAASLTAPHAVPAIVASGGDSSCTISSEGGLKCWGDGGVFNTLGDGSGAVRYSAVDVVGLGPGSAMVAVAAGTDHKCAINAAGSVKCWGFNGSGRLGDGTTTRRNTPADTVGLGVGVTSVAAGGAHSCARTADGTARCWGFNGNGQLGNNSTAASSTPVDVSGLGAGTTVAVAVGLDHSCALTVTQGVECWGKNSAGQLGDGTLVDRQVATTVAGLSSGVSAIAAGGNQTCALKTNGGLKCWGENTYGQLGNSSAVNQSLPVDVNGLTSGVSGVSVGYHHACARLGTGAARCWGRNSSGQLGDDSIVNRATSIQVAGLTSGVAEISTGEENTCARLLTGSVRCWGAHSGGQTGDGSSASGNLLIPFDIAGMPQRASKVAGGGGHACAQTSSTGEILCWGNGNQGALGNGGTRDRSAAIPVIGLTATITDFAGGYDHSCALTSTGGVKCWGDNFYGQIGDTTTTDRLTPQDVTGAVTGITTIAVGGTHSCVRTSAGAAKCWGRNNIGQIGDNTLVNKTSATQVSGLTSGVLSVAAGGGHSCALNSSGGAVCWGDNTYGQLGDGTLIARPTPVAVSGLGSGVLSIVAGDNHTCARMTNGTLRCWGRNNVGQLGDGSGMNQSVPAVVVSPSSGATSITASGDHTCALHTTTGIQCWGSNTYGELGINTTANASTPQDVPGLTSSVTSVSAGEGFTCAVVTDGTAKCWGRNNAYQLGDSTSTNRLTPTDITRWLANEVIFQNGFQTVN